VQLIIPRYHVVGDQEPAHVSGLSIFRSIEQFKADMRFFLKFYTPVCLDDIISHIDGGRQLPRRCFIPTFDDGFREISDFTAPILASQGIPAVFFLNTSVLDNRALLCEQKKCLLLHALVHLGNSPARREATRVLTDAGVEEADLQSRIHSLAYPQRHVLDQLGPVLACDFNAYAASVQPYLTSAQIKHLIRNGFAIGAHSVDHPLYSKLTFKDQLIQTRESIGYIRNHLHYDCKAFAFPFMDSGVSSDFFKAIFADGGLKVSFGSDGIRGHFFPRNLERFKMEYSNLKASQILAREFALAILRKPSWASKE
jgi:peptidoglycan/xylan/chitin deacetylase (PgdA/CDA1 family)